MAGCQGDSADSSHEAPAADFTAPEWGAVRGDLEAPAVGPVFDLLAGIDSQVSGLHELLDSDAAAVAVADLPELALRLHHLVTRLDAAHQAAVGMVDSCGALPPGPANLNAWLGASHRLDAARAGRLRRNSVWLSSHSKTASAFAAGTITEAHVNAIRVVADATDARRAAFGEFEPLVLDAAVHSDARVVARIMNAWAETVDPEAADEDADAAYDRRSLHLSEVGEGWDVRGWLPGVLGAELAGVLNEYMERARRAAEGDESVVPMPASARRADALLELARAASAADLSVGARDRANVAITVGIDAAHRCTGCEGQQENGRSCNSTTSTRMLTGASATWAVGNGPGQGFLPRCLARWATCDGEITRVVFGPDSRPLNVGRTHRVVPAYLRRVLELRDGGCIIPGCDRPTGWCEAHHVRHWAAGGETSADNLALICRKHHQELHLGRWLITVSDGIPRATSTPERRRTSARRNPGLRDWHRQREAA